MESYSPVTAEASNNKRPRSPSISDIPPPSSKSAKTSHHSNHLQINYLARQFNENIPLVSTEDTLPSILRLISDYDGVLHRHESIAGNLGACPIGPILIRRFERLFDGPPRILKSHGKETNITWLDVVEFARNKPEQFNLEKMRNGVRVCQFYTKQSRVEISEEDYVLIASGMPQKLIPPQPIMEDEEKELGALEILEKNLGQIVQLADQGISCLAQCQLIHADYLPVSARARQLNHRLRGRKAAIISRRESEADTKLPILRSQSSPPPTDDTNDLSTKPNGIAGMSQSPPIGFTAVNTRQSLPDESKLDASPDLAASAAQLLFSNANTENVTIINGTSIKGASPTTRAELMKKFFSSADRDARTEEEQRRSSAGITRSATAQVPSTRPKPRSESLDNAGIYNLNSPAAVAIPSTPASLLPHSKPSQIERDDGGPYKAEMVNRMDSLHRGERIIPPCDRCRRLHMDCLKNLTACMGCTKKHAKCSWKDVREEELRDGRSTQITASPNNGHSGIDVDLTESVPDDIPSAHQTPVLESTPHNEVRRTSGPVQSHSEERVEILTPPAEVKALPFSQQPHEVANGRAHYSKYTLVPPVRESIEQDDNDDGDRLQALAAQVYRTASQNDER